MKLPKQRLTAFLSFTGNAEEAMNFYADVLQDATITAIERFGKNDPNGDEGKVLTGVLTFAGLNLLFMDMPQRYPAPEFSWASSLMINCLDEAEFDRAFAGLSKDGTVIMGPEPVMHMRKCTWLTDRFGVTWQLVWE